MYGTYDLWEERYNNQGYEDLVTPINRWGTEGGRHDTNGGVHGEALEKVGGLCCCFPNTSDLTGVGEDESCVGDLEVVGESRN